MNEVAEISRGWRGLTDRDLRKSGLMLFVELDHGAVLHKETELTTPKMVRLVIGNPLVIKEIAKHVPEGESYVLVGNSYLGVLHDRP
jgi:hypothetical protein